MRLHKNFDGSILAPCQSELYQQFLRTSYIAQLWRHAHGKKPITLNPVDYGWDIVDNRYCFKWFEGDQLPPSVESITNDEETEQDTEISQDIDIDESSEERELENDNLDISDDSDISDIDNI